MLPAAQRDAGEQRVFDLRAIYNDPALFLGGIDAAQSGKSFWRADDSGEVIHKDMVGANVM